MPFINGEGVCDFCDKATTKDQVLALGIRPVLICRSCALDAVTFIDDETAAQQEPNPYNYHEQYQED